MPFRKKSSKRKRKNPFEASMHIDNPDIKVVTASYKKQPFFVGIGVSKQRGLKGSGQAGIIEGIKGEYQSQKDLDWQLLYNPNALPPGFIPFEKTKELMASTVAATTGSITVFQPETTYKETPPKKLKGLESKLTERKGKDPLEVLIEEGLELDHIVPLKKGGDNKLTNIRIVSRKSHRRAHKRRASKK